MAQTKEISIKRIIAKSDREYGGDGDIEALAESVKRHGIINALLVRDNGDNTYKLIAGKRRLRAAGLLNLKTVPATVLEVGEEADEEELALAENVNRLEMHPLDEAKHFSKLMASGVDVKEIALRFERSTSAIYQRSRLSLLTDDLKEWFRSGRITLSQAAVLAGLDAEQQAAFFTEHKKKTSISSWHINVFLYETQRRKLDNIADGECEACPRRTHNTDPQLFDDHAAF
jgi:ParB family chromosome partitioning protein